MKRPSVAGVRIQLQLAVNSQQLQSNMKKICLFAVTLFLSACRVNTILAQSGFEPIINSTVNDTINGVVSKGQVDKISNTMSKVADVYYSAKSSAITTQQLLSGTTTQQTQRTQETQQTQNTQETHKTAKRSRILDIFKENRDCISRYGTE